VTLEHDAPLPDPNVLRVRGRDTREKIPRTELAELGDRPANFDVVELLIAQCVDRLPDLVPLRNERMLESPFSFFRGAAGIQALDLSRDPSTEIEVQLCGDAHLSNFGVFSSPERRLVFDVNDFDETAIGPFEWDVKRLAASVVIAAESLGHTPQQQERAVESAVSSYRTSIRQFASEPTMSVWYSTLELDSLIAELKSYFSSEQLQETKAVIDRAKGKDSIKAFDKLVEIVDGRPQIVNQPPLVVPLDQLYDEENVRSMNDLLTLLVAQYATSLTSDRQQLLTQFTPIDCARKVVGVGSVGTRCFIVLLLGRDVNDPFFLQIKEASESVINVARGVVSPFQPGERVVHGQRLMQATPDAFLGWHALTYTDGVERNFYVRQLYDNKAAVNIERLDVKMMATYASVCGWTLARAHARFGNSLEVAGYLGKSTKFDEAIVSYALSYQRRNAEDYRAMQLAVNSGRISTEA
jgi:uncharacterized protein (DUF2252 family)